MKQTIITMLLVLVTLTAAAQDKEKKERLAENFFNAKVNELALRLDMTAEQKEKFIPIYRRYNDEMKAVMGPRKLGNHHPNHKKLPKNMKKHEDCQNHQECQDGQKCKDEQKCKGEKKERKQMTDEEQLAFTKKKLEKQQQAQAIRLKYVDEFSTVLSAQQVNQFFEVEKDITRMMAKRRSHHGGPHHCLPEKGQRPQGKPEKPQK